MEEIREKLEQIRVIWNNYIIRLKFFRNQCNLEPNSNHFGQVLDHFADSLHIVENYQVPTTHLSRYAFNITFLQTIYVQQDLIEEMHRIFKTGINKSQLKRDSNYSINRDIRNELVGHPIRREKGNGHLISSVTLKYQVQPNSIGYIRFEKNKNYQFEELEFSTFEMNKRHEDFLNLNLSVIQNQIQIILRKYLVKLNEIQKNIESKNISAIINLVACFYESFEFEDTLYSSHKIREVHSKAKFHDRYRTVIENYTSELSLHVTEMKNFISNSDSIVPKSKFNNLFNSNPYHYEIGGLFDKREFGNFAVYGRLLRTRIQNNSLALEELSFMENNIENEIDYYSSCHYLNFILHSVKST